MSGKNYSLIKSQYLKAIQNITITIGEIRINVSEEIKKEVKLIIASIKKDSNLTIGQKESLIHEVYWAIRNYAQDFVKSNNMQALTQEFIKSKFMQSFKDYIEKYKSSKLKQEVNNTIIEAKKEQENSSQTEEKKDPFTQTKLTILKRLGYIQGKRGSQDNSPDIEKWMLASGGNGLSRTSRGFWINDVQRISNMGALNSFLRQNRLVFKNDHLLRVKQ